MPHEIFPNIELSANTHCVTRIMTPSLERNSTEKLIVATEDEKPSEVYIAMLKMRNSKIHHMPIIAGNNKLVGVVTFTDFLRCMYPPKKVTDPLRQLDYEYKTIKRMLDIVHGETGSEDITKIGATENIHEAAEKLKSGNFHSLPVVNGDIIVGVITSTDLIEYLLKKE